MIASCRSIMRELWVADVFVSYKREDEARAKRVVDSLRSEGIDVWWDQGIGSGMEWRSEIRRRIDQARVVCVLWSRSSIESEWVAEEAEWARERGALCPALIDQVKPPLGFGGVQAANLVGWTGARRDPAWRYFIDSVRARLQGKAQPERKPPKPRSPVLPILGGVLGASAALLSIVVALEQLGVIDLLPNWPVAATSARQVTAAEAAEWTSIRRSGNCSSIASYVRRNPGGVYAGEGQAMLAARQTVSETVWEPYAQPGWTTGSSSLAQRRSREAACAEAERVAMRNATSACGLNDSDGAHRRSVAHLLTPDCTCINQAIDLGMSDAPASWSCIVRTPTTCSGEAKQEIAREICGG